VPWLALRVEEAAALGVSDDFFREHVADDLRAVRRGRVKVYAVSELQRWLDVAAEPVLGPRSPLPVARPNPPQTAGFGERQEKAVSPLSGKTEAARRRQLANLKRGPAAHPSGAEPP
jgi:hypothetical protein